MVGGVTTEFDFLRLSVLREHVEATERNHSIPAHDGRTSYGRTQIDLFREKLLRAEGRERNPSNLPLAYKSSQRGERELKRQDARHGKPNREKAAAQSPIGDGQAGRQPD